MEEVEALHRWHSVPLTSPWAVTRQTFLEYKCLLLGSISPLWTPVSKAMGCGGLMLGAPGRWGEGRKGCVDMSPEAYIPFTCRHVDVM